MSNPNIPLLGEATLTRITSKEFNPNMPHTIAYSGSRGVSVINGELHPGLHINWNSNSIPVVWKRLRRFLQTTYMHTFTAPKRIKYVEVGPLWDGICQISREYLLTMTVSAINPQQETQLKHDLHSCKRIEITIGTPLGQYKGHALVYDACDIGGYDLVIDNKPKGEITFDGWFMSVKMVHGFADAEMGTIDLQSLINHPEFLASEIERGMVSRHNRVIDGLRDGSIVKQWPDISPKGLENWPALFTCFAGAKPMWFPHLVKSIGGSYITHAKSLNEKMRFPMYNYQAYLTSATAANIPGLLDHECVLDLDRSSFIVSDLVYEQYAKIWGGADQDDRMSIAVLKEPHEVDGKPRVIVWRSPNIYGEYVIISECSIVYHGVTLCNTVIQKIEVEIDYSKLPPRIDNQMRTVLDIIPDASDNHMGEVYDPKKMYKALEDERANAGVLGTVINYLMMITLLYGDDVLNIACVNLEKLIDAAVKTGADLRPTKAWITNQFAMLGELPLALANRVRDGLPRHLRASRLDKIQAMDNEYIVRLADEIDTLQFQCQPPMAIVEYGKEYEDIGKEYRTLYATTLQSQGPDAARIACEAFLATHDPFQVLGGAVWYGLTHAHDVKMNDACVWINGEKLEVGRMRGIGHQFITLLQHLELISEPVIHEGRVLWYNSPDKPTAITFLANGPWFNLYKITMIFNKMEVAYAKMGDMPTEERFFWKNVISQAARTPGDKLTESGVMRGLIGRELMIEKLGNRYVITLGGHVFGYIDKHHEELVQNLDKVIVMLAGADDGNLQIVTQR